MYIYLDYTDIRFHLFKQKKEKKKKKKRKQVIRLLKRYIVTDWAKARCD